MAMWKANSNQSQSIAPEEVKTPTGVNSERSIPEHSATPVARATALPDQTVIAAGINFKGDITGKGALYINGRMEGAIILPGERVTVGASGSLMLNMLSSTNPVVSARELVVMGKVHGNVSVADRVEIRTDGSVTGDISASRISIADGAFFKGGIELRKSDAKAPNREASSAPDPTFLEKPAARDEIKDDEAD